MTLQHRNLAEGRWDDLSLVEKMANVGSEIERALKWKTKANKEYSDKACERALELLDLTLDSVKNGSSLKEIARVREAVVDYFYGTNEYSSSEESWRSYFLEFACAAREFGRA